MKQQEGVQESQHRAARGLGLGTHKGKGSRQQRKLKGKDWVKLEEKREEKQRGSRTERGWCHPSARPCFTHAATSPPKCTTNTLHRPGRGWMGRARRGRRRRRKAEVSSTHTVTVIGRKGGVCPRPAPSNLRERPFSSRGGNTAGFKEDKIPAGLHTHSGAGGKAAQSRDLGIQRGRTQCCHGGSPGMAFWGCCGHCSLAPEEAAVTRLMGGQSCGESSRELELRRRHWALLSALRFLPSQAIRF